MLVQNCQKRKEEKSAYVTHCCVTFSHCHAELFTQNVFAGDVYRFTAVHEETEVPAYSSGLCILLMLEVKQDQRCILTYIYMCVYVGSLV